MKFAARLAMFLAAAPISLATPAAAQENAGVDADLRCLVVGFALSGSEQEAHKNAAVPFTVYYLGQIDAQAPNLDLEKRVVDLATSMTAADIKTEAARCGADFQRRGTQLQAIGKALQDRAKAAE